MGLQIGDSLASLAAAIHAPDLKRPQGAQRERNELGGLGFSARDDSSRVDFFNREKLEPPRAGFGEGTVSVPGAAVRVVRRNLWEGRRLVPTLEDLRDNARERVVEARERAAPEEKEVQAADLGRERLVAETLARARARRFLNELNEAAGNALARVRGEEPPQPQRADIRVGDETFAYSSYPTSAPRLDVRV